MTWAMAMSSPDGAHCCRAGYPRREGDGIDRGGGATRLCRGSTSRMARYIWEGWKNLARGRQDPMGRGGEGLASHLQIAALVDVMTLP